MDPGSSKDPRCPYCEKGHVGPCTFGTPQKQQQAEVSAGIIEPPETPKKHKNFLCEDCGKAFKTRRKLTQHKSIHSGEKRYTCEHCTKGFSSKFKLVRHMVVHSKVRDWECEACGTGFRRKDHLEAHLRQHCGERTLFPCQLCSKGLLDNLQIPSSIIYVNSLLMTLYTLKAIPGGRQWALAVTGLHESLCSGLHHAWAVSQKRFGWVMLGYQHSYVLRHSPVRTE
ncbi:unnamed protein product [Nezara viridula]|uniref:C2H2-type domain-containing protein n=1 Tax=Nezara viridula TaxID=85310 RepID=A0A9P0EDW2_NEZVI|nr:unnamed protein product [Nezara viridula]